MPSPAMSASYVLAALRAREHWLNHDYGPGAEMAARAAEVALADGDSAAWWNMTFLQSECLRDQGEFRDCAVRARALSEHELAAGFPQLRTRALTLLAIALQGAGRLDDAIEAAARAAAAAPRDEDAVDLRIQAQRALIAAWAESGRLEDAWRECRVLGSLITAAVEEQTAGKAYWVMGNVAFLRNEVEDGQRYHELAGERLSPGKDLDLWAKFNKASAAMRLGARIADARTLRCIERAELATEVVGGNQEDRLLLALARAHWNYLTGDSQ
ncbi:MAG: hypothetical protein M3021_03215, partial [Actinomycetota bacterium]|nr:hypothetical protein [Actinomycetota bacterium]